MFFSHLDWIGVELEGGRHEEGGPAIVQNDGEAAEQRRVGQLGHIAVIN